MPVDPMYSFTWVPPSFGISLTSDITVGPCGDACGSHSFFSQGAEEPFEPALLQFWDRGALKPALFPPGYTSAWGFPCTDCTYRDSPTEQGVKTLRQLCLDPCSILSLFSFHPNCPFSNSLLFILHDVEFKFLPDLTKELFELPAFVILIALF